MADIPATDRTPAAPKRGACPICGKPLQVPAYRPFCSKRCADIDLHRWLGGTYAIPAPGEDEPDDPRVPPRPDYP